MSAASVDTTRPWDLAMLRDAGFRGFHAVSHLRRTSCLEVPAERGVYAVVRDTDAPPEFMARSVGGRFRQQDPTVAVDLLLEHWVEGASLLFLGNASGPGVRSLLQQRVKRCLRFGQGKVVGHWEGRFIWQLCDHAALRIAWRTTPDDDPAAVEGALLDGFELRYGRLPFANLRPEATG